MLSNKDKYRKLCETETTIPLYSQDWWLDCVCSKEKWDVLLFETQGSIEATMPFYMPHKGIITMPNFSQSMGIWFNPAYENNNYSKNLFRKQQICEYFIKKLPKHKVFLQNFNYTFKDWLPFYWHKYQQFTLYNYILPDISDKNLLWKNFNDNIKRNIIKAEKKYNLNIRSNVPIDLFSEIVLKTYKRQEKKPYCMDLMRKIIEEARRLKKGDVFGAYDDENQLHAAVFIVLSNNCAYYIAGGGNTELRHSGGHAFAVWKVISELHDEIKLFSFEGSMVKGIEHFFRSFGAIQMPYFSISKGKKNIFQKVILLIKSYLSKH